MEAGLTVQTEKLQRPGTRGTGKGELSPAGKQQASGALAPKGPCTRFCVPGTWVLCPNMSACAWAPQVRASPCLQETGRGRQPREDHTGTQARAECVGHVLQLAVCSDLRNHPQLLLPEARSHCRRPVWVTKPALPWASPPLAMVREACPDFWRIKAPAEPSGLPRSFALKSTAPSRDLGRGGVGYR